MIGEKPVSCALDPGSFGWVSPLSLKFSACLIEPISSIFMVIMPKSIPSPFY